MINGASEPFKLQLTNQDGLPVLFWEPFGMTVVGFFVAIGLLLLSIFLGVVSCCNTLKCCKCIKGMGEDLGVVEDVKMNEAAHADMDIIGGGNSAEDDGFNVERPKKKKAPKRKRQED